MSETDDPSRWARYRAAISFRRSIVGTAISCGGFLFILGIAPDTMPTPPARTTAVPDRALCAITERSGDTALALLCASHYAEHSSSRFAQQLRVYLQGYPMAQMAEALSQQDRTVAAYLIAIAKQESQWGKRVPVLNGKDCYNYWGFRAKRARMGTGGHTCFDSPQDAVETVGRRLHELVYDYRRDTAEKLLIWKCGRSCATHDPQGVARWVAVVDRYYREVRALSEATDSPAVATVVH